ncbi:MAG: SMI1/KNR4 family protein [Cyanobacteria bacterium P01_A01_bin.123]
MDTIDRLKVKVKRARFQLNPPIVPAELERFEKVSGITLPADYRAFLLQVGNGGSKPDWPLSLFYRDVSWLLPLDCWDESCWMIDNPDLSVRLAQPCPVTPAVVTTEAWEILWDNDEWDPLWGTIAIEDCGAGGFLSLIVNGEYRDRIFYWGDCPHLPPKFIPETNFFEWIEKRLDGWIERYSRSIF